jgi:hypothetical protein
MFNFKNRLMEENNGEGGDLPGGEAEHTFMVLSQLQVKIIEGVAGQWRNFLPEWFKVDKYQISR